MNNIVLTKGWLANKIALQPQRTIGRVLVALYNEQTSAEQRSTVTKQFNGVGFSKPDARVGSIGARDYAAHGTLPQWQIDCWSKPDKSGYPRICKYVAQLSSIANRAHQQCNACNGTGWKYWNSEFSLDMPCVDCDGRGFVPRTYKDVYGNDDRKTVYASADFYGNIVTIMH